MNLDTHRAELIEESLEVIRVYLLLEEMAPDLLRINPAAAETAARIMLRIKNRMTKLSSNFWLLTLD